MDITRNEFLNKYWRYYLLLENKFMRITAYVELDESNFNTYSHEFAVQLQSICSELDNVFKLYCDISSKEHSNINIYRQKILEIYPFMIWNARNNETDNNNNDEVTDKSWWTGYNRVKHSRTSSYKEANLKNTLYALGALYLIEMKIMRDIMENSLNEDGSPTVSDNPEKESEVFMLSDWEFRFVKNGILYRIDNNIVQLSKDE